MLSGLLASDCHGTARALHWQSLKKARFENFQGVEVIERQNERDAVGCWYLVSQMQDGCTSLQSEARRACRARVDVQNVIMSPLAKLMTVPKYHDLCPPFLCQGFYFLQGIL